VRTKEERKAYPAGDESIKQKEVLSEKGIRIYPNPASSQLNVEVASSTDLFKIKIADLTGKTLF